METFEDAIAVACVLHFVWSYYWNCYRKGYTMDIWHLSLFSSLFSIHLMLPFDRSDLNVFALGTGLLRRTQAHVTEAYWISAIGYFAVLAGGQVWRLRAGMGIRRSFASALKIPSKGSLYLLNSPRMLRMHGVGAALTMGAVILFYFKLMGFGFNAGSILVANPTIRPIGQFSLFYGLLIASYCLVRAVRVREPSMIGFAALLMLELSFFGSRSSLLGVAITVAVVGMVRMGRRLKLIWLFAALAGLAGVAILLDALRKGQFSAQTVLANFLVNIFYGNTFSDTRDFAVVLSFFDGQLLWGKTYLAGLLAFVPQTFSPFRAKWSLGVVTATLAGFSPLEHSGLRIGAFGEAYLNFGVIGVVFLGIFVGAAIRLVDEDIKHAVRTLPTSNLRAYSLYIVLMVVGVAQNSSGASTFYTTMLLLWLSWLVIRVLGPEKAPAAMAHS